MEMHMYNNHSEIAICVTVHVFSFYLYIYKINNELKIKETIKNGLKKHSLKQ